MKTGNKRRRIGLGTLWGWAPLFTSLFVFIQFFSNGYLPAHEIGRQLDRCEESMNTRMRELFLEEGRLTREKRMLEDEIYRERVRRTLRDPRQQTLTLRRAAELLRAGEDGPSAENR